MVDPVLLRKKLSSRQIGPKYSNGIANALQMVKEREAQVLQHGSGVVESDPGARLGILTQEELAYMIHNWALLWEIPA